MNYLKKAEVAVKTWLGGVFLLFKWKQRSKYNINDVSNCQKHLMFLFTFSQSEDSCY